MSTQKVGELLQQARERKGWTQSKVAKILGVSSPYLSDVEKNNRAINPERLRHLAKVLELTREETREVFVARGVLPPDVEKKLLRTPQSWDKIAANW